MEEKSIIELICDKFSKEKNDIDKQLDVHLHLFDLTDEYKTEIINNFNKKGNKIFDINDANTFLDFVTKVYGKSNIFSYHEIVFESPDPEKEENKNNKQMVYLDGKLDLTESKFDFEKNNFFTYGNLKQADEDYYEFTSFKSQNSYLFIKIDSSFGYGIFNPHGSRRIIFRIGQDFFNNRSMDIISEDESVTEFFENNSENDVDKLFATNKSFKANVKNLIIYQINN